MPLKMITIVEVHNGNLKLSYLAMRWPCVVRFIRKTPETVKALLELTQKTNKQAKIPNSIFCKLSISNNISKFCEVVELSSHADVGPLLSSCKGYMEFQLPFFLFLSLYFSF